MDLTISAEGPVLTDGAEGPLRYEVEVLGLRPLRLSFHLRRPAAAKDSAFAPRLLGPLGYFVEVAVETLVGERMYATTRPKAKPKLRPEDDASYVELCPGEAHGETLEDEDAQIDDRAGTYVLRLAYANHEFTGTDACPVGALAAEAVVEVEV